MALRRALWTLGLVAVLAPRCQLFAQSDSPQTRAQAAEQQEEALRSGGCSGCKVWVSGEASRTLHVLDPEASSIESDYSGTPVFWYSIGFTKVIYYSRPGVVYAVHSK
jgi:hypothetical protein